MDHLTFSALEPDAVTEIVRQRVAEPLGVAMPYNGTRRWYLQAFGRQPDARYSADYTEQTRQCRGTLRRCLTTASPRSTCPYFWPALVARGQEYMAFAVEALGWLVDEPARRWYGANHIAAACYGELEPLPDSMRQRLLRTAEETHVSDARRYLRFGVFADQPTDDLIRRTLRLHAALGRPPEERDLMADYYAGPPVRAGLWIGTDQPTVFDVPLVIHGHTALYSLQFPTPYLDRRLWRRILYDYLYIRGDEESLHPEHDPSARLVLGLGERHNGYWRPSYV
jgi:hypothetical protein